MKSELAFTFLLLMIINVGLAQKASSDDKKLERTYQNRIKKERIHGVYIPSDLADSFVQLNRLIDKESKKRFKEVSEYEAVKKLHFSFGRWMIYNWGFYEGSRLSHSIRELGIYHPDDIARFIIITYHRYLNKKDLKVKDLVAEFTEKQERMKEARRNRGTVIHQEKKKREKAPEGQ